MHHISRRALVCSATAIGLMGVAGCASQPTALEQIQNDTALLIAGLRAVLPALAAMSPSVVPPSTLAELQTNIQEASLFAGVVASAQSEAQTVAPLQSMAAAVGGAAQTAAPLHLPPHVSSVIAAADALLPAIQSPGGTHVVVAFYSADQARLILRQSAAQPA